MVRGRGGEEEVGGKREEERGTGVDECVGTLTSSTAYGGENRCNFSGGLFAIIYQNVHAK